MLTFRTRNRLHTFLILTPICSLDKIVVLVQQRSNKKTKLYFLLTNAFSTLQNSVRNLLNIQASVILSSTWLHPETLRHSSLDQTDLDSWTIKNITVGLESFFHSNRLKNLMLFFNNQSESLIKGLVVK